MSDRYLLLRSLTFFLLFSQAVASNQLDANIGSISASRVEAESDGNHKKGNSDYDCKDTVFKDRSSGYVYSPLYPSRYPNSSNCLYKISVPEGNTVLLTLYALKTEACCDKLDIYDGDGVGKLIKSLNNQLKPNTSGVFQSTGRFMTLDFISSSQVDDYGFYARFDSTPGDNAVNPSNPTDCPTANEFFGSWGVLVSPGPTNTRTRWTATTTSTWCEGRGSS